MLLVVTLSDGTEEAYEVPPTTKLRSALRSGYWYFRILDGGEIALGENIVEAVRLGNVELISTPPDAVAD